jgi:hypothetical protein
VPCQRRSIQKLPVRPLETLHNKIIPDDRTPGRQHTSTRQAFSAAS